MIDENGFATRDQFTRLESPYDRWLERRRQRRREKEADRLFEFFTAEITATPDFTGEKTDEYMCIEAFLWRYRGDHATSDRIRQFLDGYK